MKRKLLIGIMVLLMGPAAKTAIAATNTTTLNVSATVINDAQFTGTGTLSFGDYNPTSATPTDAVGTISVRATKGMSYTIYISSDRSMTIGGDTLTYELYSDAGRTAVWGSTLATGRLHKLRQRHQYKEHLWPNPGFAGRWGGRRR